MSEEQKYSMYTLSVMIGVMLMLAGVYSIVDFVPEIITDSNLTARGIDSPLKLLFNGYLGHFFRFRYLGNINWLMLPLLIHVLLTWRSRPKWEKALVCWYILALILIGLQGYFNYRYAQTLMPLTIVMVMVTLWRFLQHELLVKLRHVVMCFVLLLVVYNTYHYAPFGGAAARVRLVEEQKEPTRKDNRSVQARITEKKRIDGPSFFMSVLFGADVPDLRHHREPYLGVDQNPADFLEFVAALPLNKGERILDNNVQLLYYYTDQPGLHYWCETDTYFDKDGRQQLFANRSLEEVHQKVWAKGCRYLVTRDIYNTYGDRWANYLAQHAEQIFKGSMGFEVYRLKAVSN